MITNCLFSFKTVFQISSTDSHLFIPADATEWLNEFTYTIYSLEDYMLCLKLAMHCILVKYKATCMSFI